MTLAVIRVRSAPKVSGKHHATLRMMNIGRVNHAVLLQETPSNLGMLQKAKDLLTWGPVDAGVITSLIEARGRIPGDEPITAEWLKENTDFKSIKDLAAALADGSTNLRTIGAKPTLRLSPPRGGHDGGIKRVFVEGGALGNRGEKIVDLIQKMI